MGIFDSIKNAFGGKDESVPGEPSQAPAADTVAVEPEVAERDASEPVKSESGVKTYTVLSGDTLWTISEQVYGDGSNYMKIFEANTSIMEHPDHTLPGQNWSSLSCRSERATTFHKHARRHSVSASSASPKPHSLHCRR